MRVLVYPADAHGCGHHRLIWPSLELQRDGCDVKVIVPDDRAFKMKITNGVVEDIELDEPADVVVFQRVTHVLLAQAIPILRAQGVAVVVDVDDDLTAIHPGNQAFDFLHPRNLGKRRAQDNKIHMHSWKVLQTACQEATFVTVSTDALLAKYAPHGRGRVLHNVLADHYYDPGPLHNANVVGWPASLHNHPNDPAVTGNAIARLMDVDVRFRVFGTSTGVEDAFGLRREPETTGAVPLLSWPIELGKLTAGICPLADTAFNSSKSWLKPLELAARGVPWVGSPRTEYRRIHDMGCGHLVEKPKEWYGVIRRLLTDESLRTESAERGRAVADQLRLSKHAWRWIEAWSDALDTQRAPQRSTRPTSRRPLTRSATSSRTSG